MALSLDIVLDSIVDAILCIDDSGKLVLLNDAAARIFKCDREAVGRLAEQFPVLADVVRQLNLPRPLGRDALARNVQRLQMQTQDPEPVVIEATVSTVVEEGQQFTIA